MTNSAFLGLACSALLDSFERVLLLSQAVPKPRRTAKATAKQPRRPLRTENRKKIAPGKKTKAQVSARRAGRPMPEVAQPASVPAPPPPPARKPGFYEAVAIYERGVQALQRHDFQAAAGFFRAVLERYPEERELLERARLYLRVCERETERQQPAPKTPAERVYAATVALNSGDHSGALDHLQRALTDDPESDHAHYIMAVALGMRQRGGEAIEHLRQAIALNPENRTLARQDPDLEALRDHPSFKDALDTPAAQSRRRPAARRR
jgi:tetratricopeptide (TPR) repeat protein